MSSYNHEAYLADSVRLIDVGYPAGVFECIQLINLLVAFHLSPGAGYPGWAFHAGVITVQTKKKKDAKSIS